MAVTAARTAGTYSRVVVPLDGTAFSEGALTVARELSGVLDARIDLAGFGGGPGDEGALQQRLLDVAADYPEAHIWTGVGWDVAEALTLVVAGDERALVCMASHARHGVAGAVLGSVAAELLATWAEPVMLVGPSYDPSRRLGSGPVVVAVDGTPGSLPALPLAAAWADRLGVPLEIITVAEPVPEPPTGHHTHRHHGPGDDPEGYVEDLARQWRAPGRVVAAGALYDPVSVAGALTDYLAVRPASLAVLASRPRHGTSRAIFGSTANAVVHDSVVPVLVAPRLGAQEAGNEEEEKR